MEYPQIVETERDDEYTSPSRKLSAKHGNSSKRTIAINQKHFQPLINSGQDEFIPTYPSNLCTNPSNSGAITPS